MDKLFSDLVFEGCLLRPQATTGQFYALPDMHHEEEFTSCVLGAAWEARYGSKPTWGAMTRFYKGFELRSAYPFLNASPPACPVEGCLQDDLYLAPDWHNPEESDWEDLINHLNETHKWPREQTAAFLKLHGH